MKIRMILGCISVVAAFALPVAHAGDRVYLHPEDFVRRSFENDPPPATALWIAPALREELSREFGWRPGLRVRYWRQSARTVWILDEVGKDKPITTGVVVNDGSIESVDVLVFRESRGWEIRYPNFTRQFVSARLDQNTALTRSIDGITGATLSVRAVKRMARVALKLHEHSTTTTLARSQ